MSHPWGDGTRFWHSLSNCSAYTLKITGNKGSTFKKVQAALPC